MRVHFGRLWGRSITTVEFDGDCIDFAGNYGQGKDRGIWGHF